MIQPLDKTLRNRLERTIKDARDIAETAARAALEQLGVGEAVPFAHLSEQDRELRRKLRVHGRQLGDSLNGGKIQTMDRLIEEVAYEHWHRMLFARFLAENNLLMYPDPDDPVAVTLEECEDLAADEGAANGWELAARFAARMLPQIFRLDSPVFQLALPPEHQQKLERLVADLPLEVFTASDSLGWVYQFWQAKKKDEVNASEVKIGARELPAVTQLFTEPYMVSFLLDNSLGAWWAARRLSNADLQNASSEQELREKAAIPGVPLDYLRFVKVEAASSRFHEIGYFHKDKEIANLSGNLPHWRQDSVTYFVTFRTADSLPQEKLKLWQTEKDEWLKQHPEPHDEKTKREFYEKFPDRIQTWLDQGYGKCLLETSEYKTIVENALKHFDGDRYDLDEFVVMPNHVHVIVTPKNGHALSEILHSWKSFTANQINRRSKATGAFWQKESFDHIIRSPEQLERIRAYIRNHSAFEEKRQDAASTFSWTPAAGTFDGWPEQLADLKTLDPCCGSGHFLVAVFLMLVPMRMERDGLSAREAVDAVLRENIHGLELDQRCVELAAFALALTAWKYPSAGGYRVLPELNVACSGLSISAKKEEWLALAGDNTNLRIALEELYKQFKDAPVLGSLINPEASLGKGSLFELKWEKVGPLLSKALKEEKDIERSELAVVANGLSNAAIYLAGKFCLVFTNVPYLKGGYHSDILKSFCESRYPRSKYDLATVFIERCQGLLSSNGSLAVVTQQYWLFLKYYAGLRENFVRNKQLGLIARLGPGAFETISGEVVNVCLQITHNKQPSASYHHVGFELDAIKGIDQKINHLISSEILSAQQSSQSKNPDCRISFELSGDNSELLSEVADFGKGSVSGDGPHYLRKFWEFPQASEGRKYWLNSPQDGVLWSGREHIILWGEGNHNPEVEIGFRHHGQRVYNKKGIAIGKAGKLRFTPYTGELFDDNLAVICPYEDSNLESLWHFSTSGEFEKSLRKLDKKMSVTAGTFTKVAFDADSWLGSSSGDDVRNPLSTDPSQWIFHGHPTNSAEPLQVAVARLLGYRWPAELDASMELADEQREWVKRCEALASYADDDGIVCIPPVRGEASASDRLLNLLAAAYGDAWSNDTLAALLKSADHAGKTLETWLREKFFTQHCKLFQHRPFIWHIWDGLRDGFAALVNYHKLDAKLLETLIYTYLGDWISRQKQDIASGVDGAQERLAAAEALKKKLELILEGEAPYDIFVRWKPLEKQPIGWDPDLNDGVRLNIRPFLIVPDVGKRGAGVLRDKPNIKWTKDRGKDVESAPWFKLFAGDRINDHHLSLEGKRKARESHHD